MPGGSIPEPADATRAHEDVIGTVAREDTIFLAVNDSAAQPRVLRELRRRHRMRDNPLSSEN